jgi:hypothetical protein
LSQKSLCRRRLSSRIQTQIGKKLINYETKLFFSGTEFSLLLMLTTIFCWTFGLLWLLFADISRIILPTFMFLFGTFLVVISLTVLMRRRKVLNPNETTVTSRRRKVEFYFTNLELPHRSIPG